MKNLASLKAVQRFEFISIHPTNLVEMIEEKNFRARNFLTKLQNLPENHRRLDWEGTLQIISSATLIWLRKPRPQKTGDSLTVLQSWLVADSELDLGDPDPISVVLQLADKNIWTLFQNVAYSQLLNTPFSENWANRLKYFEKKTLIYKVGRNSCTDLLTGSKSLASPRQRRVLVMRLKFKTDCVSSLRADNLF